MTEIFYLDTKFKLRIKVLRCNSTAVPPLSLYLLDPAPPAYLGTPAYPSTRLSPHFRREQSVIRERRRPAGTNADERPL